MKITDYPNTTDLQPLDVFLTDGDRGTKKIYVQDMIPALVDGGIDPIMHRMILRGKNLGSEVTSKQLAAIRNGSFTDLYVGDYWVINNVTWRIADIDYWWNSGDTAFTNHHLVIVPDESLDSQPMNPTNITTGGYVGSAMYTANMNAAKAKINQAFLNRVLTHRQLFTNATHPTGGYPTAGAWYDSSIDLMNEPMVYGSYIMAPATAGNTTTAAVIPHRYTIDRSQLALFMLNPKMVNPGRYSYWLRDVVSAAYFANVISHGYAYSSSALNSSGVRPCYPIG